MRLYALGYDCVEIVGARLDVLAERFSVAAFHRRVEFHREGDAVGVARAYTGNHVAAELRSELRGAERRARRIAQEGRDNASFFRVLVHGDCYDFAPLQRLYHRFQVVRLAERLRAAGAAQLFYQLSYAFVALVRPERIYRKPVVREPACGIFPVAYVRRSEYRAASGLHRVEEILVAFAAYQRIYLFRHHRHARELRGGPPEMFVSAAHYIFGALTRDAEYLHAAFHGLGDFFMREARDEGAELPAERDCAPVLHTAAERAEYTQRMPYNRLTFFRHLNTPKRRGVTAPESYT